MIYSKKKIKILKTPEAYVITPMTYVFCSKLTSYASKMGLTLYGSTSLIYLRSVFGTLRTETHSKIHPKSVFKNTDLLHTLTIVNYH